jgi:hypothetical protein
MTLTPIKLLKPGVTKNTLLNLKNESMEIDTTDYIESMIEQDSRAKKLLAIEDASEMAKLYFHEKGVFEKIAKDLEKEVGKEFTFHCKNIDTMKLKKKSVHEYIMMEIIYENGTGHYGMAAVDHNKKTVKLYDPMVKEESDFKSSLKKALPRTYTITEYKNKYQPTGGFVSESLEEFKELGFSRKSAEDAYELSQFDELSQHHFCYVESLLAMMNHMGYGNPGPNDPRDRLTFVKRVIWGLLHKYVPMTSRSSAQWKYFEKNFPYIVETRSLTGKRLRMVHGFIQIPPAVIRLKKLKFCEDIDSSWSLKRIVDWAA